jgi:hypothetical protein
MGALWLSMGLGIGRPLVAGGGEPPGPGETPQYLLLALVWYV